MALYFVAIVAPENIDQQVLEWKHYMRDHFGCTVALKSPAHITLVAPFESNKEDELREAIAELTFNPFPVYLHKFKTFEKNVIFIDVLPNDALQQLREIVVETLHAKKESRFFHPHITIANRDIKEKDFPIAWDHFSKLSYQTSFTAQKISLLKHNGQRWVIVN